MAIKIIDHGVDPKTIPLIFSCYSCGAKWEADQSDCEFKPATSYTDPRETSYWQIPCPTCHQMTMSSQKKKM